MGSGLTLNQLIVSTASNFVSIKINKIDMLALHVDAFDINYKYVEILEKYKHELGGRQTL